MRARSPHALVGLRRGGGPAGPRRPLARRRRPPRVDRAHEGRRDPPASGRARCADRGVRPRLLPHERAATRRRADRALRREPPPDPPGGSQARPVYLRRLRERHQADLADVGVAQRVSGDRARQLPGLPLRSKTATSSSGRCVSASAGERSGWRHRSACLIAPDGRAGASPLPRLVRESRVRWPR